MAADQSTLLEATNAPYLEALYAQFIDDPSKVSAEWASFFSSLPAEKLAQNLFSAEVREQNIGLEHEAKQIKVLQLIQNYRLLGHLQAKINPLSGPPAPIAELSLEGLEADQDTLFDAETFVGPKRMPLKDLVHGLDQAYCGSIGVEYMRLSSLEERRWIQQRLEVSRAKAKFPPERRKALLEKLTDTEGFERYLGAKFPGAKRFSLEGGDALIPMIEELIFRGAAISLKEIVIGMAHRGRLNLLVNILGKRPLDLFDEFAGKHDDGLPSGDVKYHQGFSSDWQTSGGQVHVALAFNPSHLEIVSPVVMGSVRARQQRRKDSKRDTVLPIAVHGDSAFAGQGVVMETLNMSQTRGYAVGGTVHIIVNNQVGFTTNKTEDVRSTHYCSDVAKMIESPIFHVNADDVEACIYVAQLALDFRMSFKKDVVIDLVCYRRHGHNEADEPAATQPLMYAAIRKHPTLRQIYAEALEKAGVIGPNVAADLVKETRAKLDEGACLVKALIPSAKLMNPVDWSVYLGKHWTEPCTTSLNAELFEELAKHISTVPENYPLHPRVAKIMDDRANMAAQKQAMDWGFAETMAYAGLLKQGYGLRISGQDCGRGTFFHRHAVLHNQETGACHSPLASLATEEGPFAVIDSLLSEEAVLGFEYGYASAEPRSLVIWEAQFGDFANGAQVVIDQFISSGEQKWGRLCGLTLLLPHGYEGQGPEHSSARLERFLQLCAEENMQVCVPTTPAQVFHMLRRQAMRPVRKPLIVMSPKSLLRHRLAVSPATSLIEGHFELVIDEVDPSFMPKDIRRIVLCSGKVYYELLEKRESMGIKDIVLIRIEQLYPFPEQALKQLLTKYPKASEMVWAQEEPQNQGAWLAVQEALVRLLAPDQSLRYAGRPAAAAPAVGHFSMHQAQQDALIQSALA